MLKQVKVYGQESKVKLPELDYSNWYNPVSLELAKHSFNFLNRILIRQDEVIHISDLVANKREIILANNTDFKHKETTQFVKQMTTIYGYVNDIVGFSEGNEAEDVAVVSHIKQNGKHYLSFYMLRKILDLILTDREIIEVISGEFSAFGYDRLSEIALSENELFNKEKLMSAKEELSAVLKEKFLSEKSMKFAGFLWQLLNDRKANNLIFMIDVVNVLELNH